MSKADYDLVLADLLKIEDPDFPGIPVSNQLQEAEDLYVWCQKDKDVLVGIGLDWKIAESIPVRAGALRYIQSEWSKVNQTKDDARIAWSMGSPEAYALRDDLLHHFLFAYRDAPDVLPQVKRIAQGTGHADMIQDLSDLSALGKAFPSPLTKIGLDVTLLDKAAEQSELMAELLARSNGSKKQINVVVLCRNRASAFLKQAVDEVRRCGQYAFWHNEARKRGYVSIYVKMKSEKRKR